MSTVRQQIVDALENRLKTITTANGYATQIGSKVYPWRKTPLQVAELPCLVFIDGSADIAVDVYPKHSHRMTVDIMGFVTTKTSPEQARALAQDILTAIGTDDTLGGLCIEIIPSGHEISNEVDGDIVGAVKTSITVHYRTDLWKI